MLLGIVGARLPRISVRSNDEETNIPSKLIQSAFFSRPPSIFAYRRVRDKSGRVRRRLTSHKRKRVVGVVIRVSISPGATGGSPTSGLSRWVPHPRYCEGGGRIVRDR